SHAVTLARATGAQLHVVTAWSRVPGLAMAGAAGTTLPIDDGAWVGALHQDITAAAGEVDVVTHALEAGPAAGLLGVAASIGADLIVVGNRGMTGLRGKLGSVPNAVAHKAPCAVLVVPTS
ncbi:MAG: UspA domain protein, partial [Frankiales bacterium]|nr:UspA domain protein [Frankiales bacterium]